MEYIYNIVKNNPLFEDKNLNDFITLSNCLSPTIKSFKNKEIILNLNDPVDSVYIIISGSVKVIKESFDGKENIIAKIISPQTFGEVFACATIPKSPVSVISLEKTEVLIINYQKITTCCTGCLFHLKLIENMLKVISRKNLVLHQKIEIISKRSIRERLLMFFSMQNSNNFTITYSRENLAAYLCVDRSAMSNELSKMQKDGLIKYHKNEFQLLY